MAYLRPGTVLFPFLLTSPNHPPRVFTIVATTSRLVSHSLHPMGQLWVIWNPLLVSGVPASLWSSCGNISRMKSINYWYSTTAAWEHSILVKHRASTDLMEKSVLIPYINERSQNLSPSIGKCISTRREASLPQGQTKEDEEQSQGLLLSSQLSQTSPRSPSLLPSLPAVHSTS